MSKDKNISADANTPLSLTNIISPLSLSSSRFSPLVLISHSFSVVSLPVPPLVTLFVILCHSCCIFAVSLCLPAVSLSGLGVGFGDSVPWILPWLRPKLLRPHGAAAPPGLLPAHPFLFTFFLLLSLALGLRPTPPPSQSLYVSLSICNILFRGNSL